MGKSLKIRFLSLVVCILMLITSIPVLANANSGLVVEELTAPKYNSYSSYLELGNLGIDDEEFIAYLSEKLWNYEEKIDISKYRIPFSDDVVDLLSDILILEMPESFNVDGFIYSHKNYYVEEIRPEYILPRSEYIKALSKVQETKNEILEGIKGNDKLTEVEKALLIHDRLALTCEYDFDSLKRADKNNIYNLYGTLVEGKAVCQGYALAYDYLLEEIGMESYVCSSNYLKHAWNIITVDGVPYHVDVTWDDLNWSNDTTAGVMGGVAHNNFLKSTRGIINTGHYANDFDSYPSNTKYDNNQVWHNSETAFQLINNELYYFDKETRQIKSFKGKKVIKNLSESWGNSKHQYGSYVKLASDGKDLFYSLPNAIYKLDLKKLTSCAVFKPKLKTDYSIYGFQYEDGYFIYDVNKEAPGYYSATSYLSRGKELYNPNVKYHTYTNNCDKTCNTCGEKRTPPHNYSAATCTKPKTCKTCKATSGKKLEHTYTNNCDKTCNSCGGKRTPPHNYSAATCTKPKTCKTCKATSGKPLEHKYSNACDKTCNRCSATRKVGAHKYSSACDASCNVCGAKRNITHTYKNVITKATLTKNGSIRYKCSKCGYYSSKSTVIRYPKTVKLSDSTYTYTGKVKTPSVIVKDSSGKTLKKNTDYTVSLQSGRKNIGKYKVTITFKGKYSGKRILYFTIVPKSASIKSLTPSKKALNVKINRTLKESTGYQIQYSTSKTFKNVKTINVSNYKTSLLTIKNLKQKTTYYVRIRTYKTVGGVKYYSNWSSYKYKKTK